MLKREPPTYRTSAFAEKNRNAHPNVFIVEGVSINTIFMVCGSGHECHGHWEEQCQDQSIGFLNNAIMMESICLHYNHHDLISGQVWNGSNNPHNIVEAGFIYPLSSLSLKIKGYEDNLNAFSPSLVYKHTTQKLTIQYQEVETNMLIWKVALQVYRSAFIDMTYYQWASYKHTSATRSSNLLGNAHMACRHLLIILYLGGGRKRTWINSSQWSLLWTHARKQHLNSEVAQFQTHAHQQPPPTRPVSSSHGTFRTFRKEGSNSTLKIGKTWSRQGRACSHSH